MKVHRVALTVSLVTAFIVTIGLILESQSSASPGFVVTRMDDPFPDGCLPADCSLREAIIDANANPGLDAIQLPAGSYTLTIMPVGDNVSESGDLDITDDLTIIGEGVESTSIDAAGLDTVMEIAPGDTSATAEISDLTIEGGRSGGTAGINNYDTLALTNVVLTDNIGDDIGGLANFGTLTLTDVTVSHNASNGDDGGGIANFGPMTLNRVTIYDNSAGDDGGGIANFGPASATNVTFSGNTAEGGGGIANFDEFMLLNVTFFGNGAMNGGALYDFGPATLKNTILAGSTSGGNCGADDPESLGHNISTDNTCGLSEDGDRNNQNPNLEPLEDNGGPTMTHALPNGSIAIDTASDDCPPPTDDQRGFLRPAGDGCDVGAYEAGATPPTPTPTPTPSVIYIQGDNDCDGDEDAVDALVSLQSTAGVPYNQQPDCLDIGAAVPAGGGPQLFGDIDCDGDVDAVDALQILRHVAGLSVNQGDGCTPIGAPL